MSKQSGMGAAVWVDGVDLSGDVASLSRINSGRAVTPLTGVDKSAMERGHTLRDGGFEVACWMNKAAGQAHPTLKAVTSADRLATYAHRTTLGAPAASMLCKQLDYAGSRPDDASLTWTVTAESNGYGVDWTQMLTAGKATHTAATNGTGVDFGAATAFGLQAYLHVFAFTGTSVTIKIQESSDNAGDAYADVTGGGFTVVSAAPTFQRIETSRTLAVERYLRVVTTGTFSNCIFAVGVKKNAVSTVF